MVILVAFATDQRNVDDSPRWIEPGSAANVSMRGDCGFGGGGAGASTFGAGGGGGAAATFFLHPAAAIKSVAVNTAALSVLIFIRMLMSSWPSFYEIRSQPTADFTRFPWPIQAGDCFLVS